MSAFRKSIAALALPITAMALVTSAASPSQAALCNIGFVYGVSIDGSKVCVPLTDEVIDIIGASAEATPAPTQGSQSPPVATPPEAEAPPKAAYVNSDNGNAVAVDAAGAYVDSVEKVRISPSVTVPVDKLKPDAAVMESVEAKATPAPDATAAAEPATPSSAPTPTSSASAASSPSASPSSTAAATTQSDNERGRINPLLVFIGIVSALFGVIILYFGAKSISKAINPDHGRRRATAG